MNTRFIAGSILALFLLAAPHAQAQSSSPQIEGLLGQIKALQAQLAQLMAKLPASADMSAQDTIGDIVSRLRLGSEGDEVRALQELLKRDPSIYPEGLVTGYFGPRTAEAVKRFQARHGLESLGEVGPLTRAKIREWRLSFKKTMQDSHKISSSSNSSPSSSGSEINSSSNNTFVDSLIDEILENDGSDSAGNEDSVDDSLTVDPISVSE